MPPIERDAHPGIGGHFWRENGVIMFKFVIDPGNIVGPRPASAADKENHAALFEAFSATDFNGADPAKFDHDGDGAPGGRLPHAAAERVSPETGDATVYKTYDGYEVLNIATDDIAAAAPVHLESDAKTKRKYTRHTPKSKG